VYPTYVEISFFLPMQKNTYDQQASVSYLSGDNPVTPSPYVTYSSGEGPRVSYLCGNLLFSAYAQKYQ
jgi:hypothetical protein